MNKLLCGVVVLSGLLFMLVPIAPAAAGGYLPDPTPFGPQRTHEPDVAGPANIDSVVATVRKDGGSARGIEVTLDRHSRTATGEKPAAARRFVFLFDRSIRFNSEAFPICTRQVIETRGVAGCPAGSQVGSGRAEFYPQGAADVAVFNTRYANGRRGVLITIPAIGAILENTFEPVVWPYTKNFRWGSDEIIPPDATAPQNRGASTRFLVSFGAARNGRSFVESSAPAGTPLVLGGRSEFVTGQVLTDRGTAIRP
ncbi:hypothetical protein ACFCV3_02150 [Kribbella sp. NPDC056345]|uniref:hypothetical protein n=1 Tax=Kribbella sp. NPDC056345 TaxID=3345789 RepID=UPI0035D9C72D